MTLTIMIFLIFTFWFSVVSYGSLLRMNSSLNTTNELLRQLVELQKSLREFPHESH